MDATGIRRRPPTQPAIRKVKVLAREGMSSRGSGFCDRGDLSWTGTDCRAAARLKRTGMVLVLGIGAEDLFIK
ncbi:MAG: hypothetical protein ACYCXH_07920 [Bellilinea sp.]